MRLLWGIRKCFRVPPARLDTVTGSSEGDPTTVTTIGDLLVVVGADTESTVAGDDSNLLGVDVSTPPAAQGVEGEVDAQYGEVGKELVTAAVLTPSGKQGDMW